MDAPALARVFFTHAYAAAAVIYPACYDDAPRIAGLDGKSASWVPITHHELEARCAQRVEPAPVRPVMPSRSEFPSHLRRLAGVCQQGQSLAYFCMAPRIGAP